MARYDWLASTVPATGLRCRVMYLGCVRVTEADGRPYWCVGRFAVLFPGCRHDWMEPFRNDFATEAAAVAAYRQAAAEWESAVPYDEYRRLETV